MSRTEGFGHPKLARNRSEVTEEDLPSAEAASGFGCCHTLDYQVRVRERFAHRQLAVVHLQLCVELPLPSSWPSIPSEFL